MKIAFSLTALDLARALSSIARQAAVPPKADKGSSISPEALAADREAADGQS